MTPITLVPLKPKTRAEILRRSSQFSRCDYRSNNSPIAVKESLRMRNGGRYVIIEHCTNTAIPLNQCNCHWFKGIPALDPRGWMYSRRKKPTLIEVETLKMSAPFVHDCYKSLVPNHCQR